MSGVVWRGGGDALQERLRQTWDAFAKLKHLVNIIIHKHFIVLKIWHDRIGESGLAMSAPDQAPEEEDDHDHWCLALEEDDDSWSLVQSSFSSPSPETSWVCTISAGHSHLWRGISKTSRSRLSTTHTGWLGLGIGCSGFRYFIVNALQSNAEKQFAIRGWFN